MKYCTACGHSIADEAKFCRECGEKQVVKEVVKPAGFPKTENIKETDDIQQTASTPKKTLRTKKHYPAIYTLLLVLSFIGPIYVLSITFAFLFFGLLLKSHPLYLTIGTVWFITALTTFIGTILLLLKRKTGWKVYMLSQVIYIIAGIFAALSLYSEPKTDGFEFVITIFFIIPAIILLFIFKRKKFQDYLR
ncbi:zinc ribbon protein [Kordia periserrulae]|uniref:Zinc ribbon protein n=1 Tax=Kordia periserrulae TaxID=701523 RepID=A0A2T6C2W3_9FLAO|nr:zinc ribbon domain-containing protein [Kordia periserrulae]PTX62654.1 zinc ribbon protein [Kordia periserrulae]